MSKRTVTDTNKVNPKNFHPTPYEAAEPLAEYLPEGTVFTEPCAGAGDLIRHLEKHGHVCKRAYDIDPKHKSKRIEIRDASNIPVGHSVIITNPPFEQKLLKPLMDYWIGKAPLWLLLPSDMLINKWFNDYASHVEEILPIGRVSWMGNGQGGFENYVWAHFATEEKWLILPRF